MVCFGRPYHFKFIKGCLLKILSDSFSNTFSQLHFPLQKMFSSTVFKNFQKGISQKLDLVKQELDYMRLQYFKF